MPDIVAPGDRLGERYRLERPLGAGGMATVWRAVDLVLDRAVAVKVPLEGRPEEFTRRLRREAQAAAALTHPNITGVFDYGEHETGLVGRRGRIPYVVMELLDGETLSARLARGPLPWREAAGICARVADALAAAHAADVVHRDIKPANVFLTPVGVKVLDFGIAFTGTSGGEVLGTPAYVAPELLTGTAPTSAADIYSLGVVLHECLTGAPPTPASTFRKDTPDEVADLCHRCMAPDPGARPSATDVARLLAGAAGIQLASLPSDEAAPPADHGRWLPDPPEDPTEVPTVVLDDPAPPAEPRETAGEPVSSGGPAAPGGSPPSGKPAPASARKPLVIAGAAVGAAAVVAALLAALAPDSSDRAGAGPSAPPSATRTAAIACSVSYRVDGAWPQGFQATVRITNLGGAAIDGWKLGFAFPDGQAITQIWNGAQEQDGASVTVTAADWNRSIPPRGTAEFGFLGRQDGDNGTPSRFTLNGGECRG
ncbi:protein kinase domain-containing protein [Spirillospora sp. CA-128828]|uniref:protein kinase domain-containing protein n=1 Tax=Spirillospora sp. CA-128828 TaxID=3240033 RepID=UPI003D8ABC54